MAFKLRPVCYRQSIHKTILHLEVQPCFFIKPLKAVGLVLPARGLRDTESRLRRAGWHAGCTPKEKKRNTIDAKDSVFVPDGPTRHTHLLEFEHLVQEVVDNSTLKL